jgi:hypothetical protein
MSRSLGLLAVLVFACTPEGEPKKLAAKAEPPPQIEQKQPAVEPPPQPPPPVSQFDPQLGNRFVLAAEGLEVADAVARDRGPSWQPPTCELEYRFRIEFGGEGVARTAFDGSWTARAESPGMILKNGEIRPVNLADPTRRAGEGTAAGSLAEIHLQTDGRAWTEVDGPTSLWSAYQGWVGLTKFHPALPDGGAPGSSADWIQQHHKPGAAGRVEGQRGSLEVPDGVELPKPEPIAVVARVTLERWIEIGGTAAVVIRSWSERDEEEVHERSQGQFVVLDSGVLLHAELRERATHKIGASSYEVAIEGEARLVRSCGGPVLPPP